MEGHILAIDDEKDMLKLLEKIIRTKTKYKITTTANAKEAINLIENANYDLVIIDLKMPEIDGINLLKKIKRINPSVAAIIITAYGTVETAVEAMKLGAYDFITKPFRTEQIVSTINRIMELQLLRKENIKLKTQLMSEKETDFIIGKSDTIRDIYRYASQIAQSSASVLITGETGTGKEMLARFIHNKSKRQGEFVAINCSAFPETLIESELFGYKKGAFTGAEKDKKGLVEIANNGTLFLDEIGDLDLSMQTKLLRFLQNGEYIPVGSTETKKVDVRVIAATNKNIYELINKGKFRQDLFYRLNVIHISLPPLRERKKDIPYLAMFFLGKYSKKNKKEIKEFSSEALEYLINKEWPGNIRELENVIERAVILCNEKEITLQHLDPLKMGYLSDKKEIYTLSFKEAKKEILKEFYREYFTEILTQTKGNISEAANLCGLKRQYFYKLLKFSNINPSFFRKRQDNTIED